MLILLIALITQVPPPPLPEGSPVSETHVSERKFIIYIDDSRESQILKTELTRNWKIEENPIAQDLENRRQTLAGKCTIHEVQDYVSGFPAWRYGERGQLYSFDKRIACSSGMALHVVETIVYNELLDLGSWKHECQLLDIEAENQYKSAVIDFGYKYGGKYPPEYCEYIDEDTFIQIENSYNTYDGFPQRQTVVYPPKPYKRLPYLRDINAKNIY
ncbi:MAG: hypothetical protein KGI50_06990 [Patescibacteria group bacterium]|nr:hypothetical protein [Patescibacteria group bacterium]